MEDSMLLKKENLFSNNVKNLVVQYKNDIIIKSINLFLSSNYRESEIVLLTEYPENSFNEDSLVQYLMGHIKLKLEEYESALNYFCQSLKNEVNQAALIYDSRGLTCLYQRDYNGAIKNLGKTFKVFKAEPISSLCIFHSKDNIFAKNLKKLMIEAKKEYDLILEKNDFKSVASNEFKEWVALVDKCIKTNKYNIITFLI